MSMIGGIAAGLAFLPNWLNDAKDDSALDVLLSGWVRSSGWRSAGLVWPVDPTPELLVQARPDGVERLPQPPAESGDVTKGLLAGGPTAVWRTGDGPGRLYTLITPPGRPAGVVWAESSGIEAWGDEDRNYLRLAARLIERSPAFVARIGPVIDPERLQQRIADAAVIAGRMAHDFDNILTGIIGFADLSLPMLPAGSQQAKFVAEIGSVGHRGIQFTQQLHQLSRSAQAKPQPGSVAQVVAKEEARLRPTMPLNVAVATTIPATLAPVGMEAGPLGIVLGHLLQNAAEASTTGGKITVEAELVELSCSDARTYFGAVGPGPHVEVTIRDGGSGIKPEVRAKLFAEPFFTTKVRHRGLGLAIVYRTLCAHRGGVRIDTPPGREAGTVARIVIPPAAARPTVAATTFAAMNTFGG